MRKKKTRERDLNKTRERDSLKLGLPFPLQLPPMMRSFHINVHADYANIISRYGHDGARIHLPYGTWEQGYLGKESAKTAGTKTKEQFNLPISSNIFLSVETGH